MLLWACGLLVTHHRKAGRHYYDRPERVIPSQYFELEPLIDEEAYYRWIVMKRFQASGKKVFMKYTDHNPTVPGGVGSFAGVQLALQDWS